MNSDFILAIHALVFLEHMGQTVASGLLAENICTNPSRVRRVLAKLKKAGLVQTKEGRQDGGYLVTGDMKKTTLYAVGKALESEYVSVNWHSGDSEKNCRIASGMADVTDMLMGELNRSCEESLKNWTIADISHRLLG